MSVPDYESLMAPVLRQIVRAGPLPIAQLRDEVAAELGLTDGDRAELLPSGGRLYDSRVHWAITYMAQAGLVRRPKRGVVEATERGREVLTAHPDRIDNSVLVQFEEFREFKVRARARPKPRGDGSASAVEEDEGTPKERLVDAVAHANAAVAGELLDRVRGQPPAFLERLVLKLLLAMGYGGRESATEHLGRAGDEGLDGVIRQDALGLEQVYVQAKRYTDQSIGRPDIQAFVGALHGAQADRGIFITTTRFTPDAQQYADRVSARLVLIDGPRLAQLMIAYNVGVQDEETFVLKRVDEDFFEEI